MTNIELLNKGLKEIGISCSEKQISAFMAYLSELKKWNRAYNLTALKTDADIIVKHFLDSLLYLRVIPEGVLKLGDAGAGAGFPGIPIKIIRPEIEIDLIESSRKKTAFLRHIIRHLNLTGINVIEQRLERLGKTFEQHYDVAVSRATFHIKEFLSAACPCLKDSGLLIMNKGPKMSEELNELKRSPYMNAVREVLQMQLPFTDAGRYLIVLSCKMKK